MTDLNLVLAFKLTGDTELQVKGASRMKVDGRGGLVLYDRTGEMADRIETGALESFCIHSVSHLQSVIAA